MIVYYSGTGNSRYCAQLLAHRLEDTLLDALPLLRRNAAEELSSSTPWVFVAPTYGWQFPRLLADLLRRCRFSGHRDAWFVLTCGSEIGNAAAGNEILCRQLGLTYRGTLPVVMPENYIALFRAPAEEEARSIRQAALPGLEEGAACIRAGRSFPPVKAGWADRLKSGPVNAFFYRFILRAKAFAVSDACTGCGRCEAVCPLNNLRLVDQRPQWGDHCTHCMACICGCPAEAISYGRATRGKVRYQCPPYAPDNAGERP